MRRLWFEDWSECHGTFFSGLPWILPTTFPLNYSEKSNNLLKTYKIVHYKSENLIWLSSNLKKAVWRILYKQNENAKCILSVLVAKVNWYVKNKIGLFIMKNSRFSILLNSDIYKNCYGITIHLETLYVVIAVFIPFRWFSFYSFIIIF